MVTARMRRARFPGSVCHPSVGEGNRLIGPPRNRVPIWMVLEVLKIRRVKLLVALALLKQEKKDVNEVGNIKYADEI